MNRCTRSNRAYRRLMSALNRRRQRALALRKRRERPVFVEQLEPRLMFSTTALFDNGTLTVTSDAGDAMAITVDAGNVLVNGIDPDSGALAAASVTSLIVNGGPDANVIDLSAVTDADFTTLNTVTINGNGGGDTITGSALADTIHGGDGADTIHGGDGNDIVYGDGGDDVIHGDGGDDEIHGGDGNDTINGDDGNDTIHGDGGNDLLMGDAGNDTIHGGAGVDQIFGNDDNDILNGGEDGDTIDGGAGDDIINGGTGNDLIFGGDDNDIIHGNEGDDEINGDAGNDEIYGDAGNDVIHGGADNDVLYGNDGDDDLFGDAGDDELYGDAGDDDLDGGDDFDKLRGGLGADTYVNGEDVIGADYSKLGNELESYLELVQLSLDSTVFSRPLPLLGDQLAGDLSLANLFISNPTTAGQFLAGDDGFADDLAAALNGVTTALETQQALFDLFGPGQMNILGDTNGDLTIDINDIEFVEAGDGDTTFNMLLTAMIVAEQAAFILGTTSSLDENGQPNDPIRRQFLDWFDGNKDKDVSFDLSYTYNFAFGLTDSGFAETPDATDELSITIDAFADQLQEDVFQIGLLNTDLTPRADGVTFNGTFTVDILANAAVSALLDGAANIDLDVDGWFFDPDDGSVDINLHIISQFAMDWVFEDADPGDLNTLYGNKPTLRFDNVQLDLDSFFGGFVTDIIDTIQTVTKPLEPLVDVLIAELPVLTDLNRIAGLNAPNTLAEIIGGDPFQRLLELIDFINDIHIPTAGSFAGAFIDMGWFELSDPRGGSTVITDYTGNPNALDDAESQYEALFPDISVSAGDGPFFAQVNPSASDGMSLPIFSDPTQTFNLFAGQDATLFLFDLPQLTVGAGFEQFFPIYGPLGTTIDGSVSVTVDLKFGYDTYGLRAFRESGNFFDVLDGFYVFDQEIVGGAPVGEDPAEFIINAQLGATMELNLLGIVRGGVWGGIYGDINFNLNDLPDPDTGLYDGRVRMSEIEANLAEGALCIFEVDGAFYAGLKAFVKVGIEIDVGFFTISITIFSYEKTLARTTLLDFTYDCDPTIAPPPLAFFDDLSGVLTLNTDVGGGYTSDDRFFLTPIEDETLGKGIRVTARGGQEEYFGVTDIVGDMGVGDNIVIILPGIDANAHITGGDGIDQFYYLGNGHAVLVGNGGNDLLRTFGGDDELYGGDGDDELYGGGGNDILDGGAGNDIIRGDDGDDTIDGGDGDDDLEGGAGNDVINGGAGIDLIQYTIGDGSDTINGGSQPQDEVDVLTILGSNAADILSISAGGTGSLFTFGNGDVVDVSLVEKLSLFMGRGADHVTLNDLDGLDFETIDVDLGSVGVGDDDGDKLSVHGRFAPDALQAERAANIAGSGVEQNVADDTFLGEAGEIAVTAGADFAGIIAVNGLVYDLRLLGVTTLDVLEIFGSDGDDTFEVLDGVWDVAQVIIDGQGGNDTLIALDVPNVFTFTGHNAGNLNGSGVIGFTNIENFVGGSDTDLFVFSDGATLDGTIDGGDGIDILDFSAYTAGVVITLPTNLASPINGGNDQGLFNVEHVTGGAGDDRITGDAFDNILIGSGGNDWLVGGAGDDTLNGGEGDDQIFGGTGNDTLIDGAGNDQLFGGEGDDLYLMTPGSIDAVTDSAGNDTLDFSGAALGINLTLKLNKGENQVIDADGNELIINGDFETVIATAFDDNLIGNDLDNIFFGGDGNDTIDGGKGNDTLNGEGGNDTIFGRDGDDTLDGGDGDDLLDGGAGNDTLHGGAGVDNLLGGAGDDRLSGGADNDTLDGGSGFDLLFYVAPTRGVNANLLNETTTDGLGGADTAVNFEGIIGTPFEDDLTGDDRANLLEGGDGNDRIDGGKGNDIILGGEGDDELIGGDGNDTFEIGDGDGRDLIRGDAGRDVVLVTTTNDDDTALVSHVGGDMIRVVLGGAASGTIDIFGDTERLDFAMLDGNDQLTVTDLTGSTLTSITGNLGAGNDTVDGSLSTVALDIFGGDGDDHFQGGRAADRFTGDGGIDTIDYSAAPIGINATLPNVDPENPLYSTVSNDGHGKRDRLLGIEVLIGSPFNDKLTGGNSDDQIFGMGGNDTIDGRSGADLLVGGDGDDIIRGTNGADRIIGGNGNDTIFGGSTSIVDYSDSPNAVDVNLITGVANDGLGGVDTLKRVVNVRGTAFDDTFTTKAAGTIFGEDGDDTLIATSGRATLIGGAGDDIIQTNKMTGTVVWNAGDGSDEVDLGNGRALLRFNGDGGDDTFTLDSPDGVTLRVTHNGVDTIDIINTARQTKVEFNGFAGSDLFTFGALNGMQLSRVTANMGDDDDTVNAADFIALLYVHGGAGDDWFIPGANREHLFGDDGDDMIDLSARTVAAIVSLNGTLRDANKANINLRSFERAIGTDFDDKITGSSADDHIMGGLGNDNIKGGSGNDLLEGGDGDDTLDGGAGDDRLRGQLGNDILIGGSGVDFYDASDGPAVNVNLETGRADDGLGGTDTLKTIEGVIGSDFDDVLIGDKRNNVFRGGAGDDTINAGDGKDRILWSDGDGSDIIDTGGGIDSMEVGVDNPFGKKAKASDSEWVIDAVGANLRIRRLNLTPVTLDVLGVEQVKIVTGSGNDSVTLDDIAATSVTLVEVNLGSGDDIFDGSASAVTTKVFGGAGNDQLHTGRGNDLFNGGADDDIIFIHPGGTDRVEDTEGNNTIDFSNAPSAIAFRLDRLRGQSQVVDANGNVVRATGLFGTLVGSPFDDTLIGSDGDDIIRGNDGNDVINGGKGNDTLAGEGGDDILNGEDGDDLLDGGAGDDTIDGGDGNDLLDHRNDPAGIDARLGDGETFDGHGGHDTFTNVVGVIGSPFDDTLTGSAGNNRIFGEGGDDTINAGNGEDLIEGGDGNDTINSGVGPDTVTTGTGDDVLLGDVDGDTIFGEDAAHRIL